ncbi:MAG: hypothetical protein JWR12_2626 [Mucilaginibacter sp.]|nr:hypothetical protein [Mucilaginibacter sp.]
MFEAQPVVFSKEKFERKTILINFDQTFMKKLLLAIIALSFLSKVRAQTATDSTVMRSPLKTMSDKQYTALIKGEDLYDMALAGELNHYPSPDKVIKFKKELGLNAAQIDRLNIINKELRRKKLEMGLIIIKNERVLDSIFKYHLLNNGSLIFYANRYGLYQGELRNVILQACLVTRTILTSQQISRFEALQKAN